MDLELAVALERVTGQTCCGVIAGSGTGSVVELELGARRPRERPLKNTFLRPEQRTGAPEMWVMIYCAWRLEAGGEAVFGSGDEDALHMVRALDALVGATVLRVEAPGDRDLVITFDRELIFRAFADMVTVDDPTNYVISIGDQYVSR